MKRERKPLPEPYQTRRPARCLSFARSAVPKFVYPMHCNNAAPMRVGNGKEYHMEKKIPYSQTPEYRRARYKMRIAQGICPLCGGEPAPGRKRCLNCLAAVSVAKIKRYERMTDEQRKELSRKLCTYAKARRERRKAAGQCTICGGDPIPGTLYCARCKARVVANDRKTYERRKRMKMEEKSQA